jgi:DNA-binding Lrp family transcriptional regulator
MVTAFILVSSFEPPSSSSYDLRDKLLKIDGVKEAHLVFGQYDLVLKAEAPDSEALGRLIFGDIRSNECVMNTTTLTVVP